jgi:hypothetical protein
MDLWVLQNAGKFVTEELRAYQEGPSCTELNRQRLRAAAAQVTLNVVYV